MSPNDVSTTGDMMPDELKFESAVVHARAIQNDTGFLPALDDPRLDAVDVLFWVPIEGDGPLNDLIALQKAEDPATRAVVGATLHALMAGYPEGEPFDGLRDAYRRFVESVPVSDVSDPALLRWELHIAAVGSLIDRTLALGRRLETVGPTAELRELFVKTAFVQVHPSSRTLDFLATPSALDPLIHEPGWHLQNVVDLFIYILATTVEQRGELAWNDPDSLSPSALEALIDVEATLKRVHHASKALTPVLRAVQSWCWFAEGVVARDAAKLNQAASSYETLPPYPSDTGPTLSGLSSAAQCFARAGNWSGAIAAARKWIVEDPNDAQAHRRLAEAHYKRNEIPEAIQALEEYIRLRKEGDNDWESSLLLRLGLETRDRRAEAVALETAAFGAPVRPQGERLISWFLPWFDALSVSAKDRWWVGMFSLSSPVVADQIGSERWNLAADAFGEAVAFELKERVFLPFAASAPVVPPNDHWKRVLSGHGMLGQMIESLLQARAPNHTAARQLSGWLGAKHPGLQEQIRKTRPDRLLELARLRGQAQHGSVSEAQARQVFIEASALLSTLVGKPPPSNSG